MSAAQNPPSARRLPHSSEHHGVVLDDPYAWLQDPAYPEVQEPEILDYLHAENAYFDAQMAPLAALVETLFSEIKGRRPLAEHSVPWRESGYWYQWRFHADAQYRTWYWAPAASGQIEPPAAQQFEVLLDERQLADGCEYFRLGALELSPDRRQLAYSVDTDGSERFTLHLIDIATGAEILTPITDTAGAVVFSADGDQLFYRQVNAEWRPYRVMRRALDAAEAVIVYEEQDPAFFVSLNTTQSDAYLVIGSGDHITSELRLLRRDQPLAQPRLLSARRSGHEYDVEHRGEQLLIRSNREHKNYGLYTTHVDTPEEAHWQLLRAGSDAVYLTGLVAFESLTVLSERVAGLDQIQVLPVAGEPYRIAFPEDSYSVDLGTNAEFGITQLRLGYESMVTPHTVYDYDLQAHKLIVRKVQEIPSGYDASQYRTERLQITARDGVQVPVSLVYHKDHPPTAQQPLYLYGYGAYGIAIEPGFSATRLSLLDRGVSFAIAHIRGGDDLGYAWYEAGKLQQRTNTFNDFADTALALIAQGFTGKGRVAAVGGSAGGELVGAVVNQISEELGAAVLHVPFVDVLNTMLDAELPLTPMEWPEWGNPIEDATAFHFIRSYSPYDQLTAGDYPPMLVTGGLNDPRVTYWEPAKYVAKLRTLKTDNNPLLLKINMGAGHGGQSGRFNALREDAQEYAFVLHSLGCDH